MNEAQAELEETKDFNSAHKRRVQEMLSSILRDLNEVGTALGSSASDFKVRIFRKVGKNFEHANNEFPTRF